MAKTFSNPAASALLKEVDKTVQAQTGRGEVLVVLDSQGQIYMQKPSGVNFFKTFRYFIVDTAGQASFNGFLCALRHKSEITKILVEYEVKCSPKNAQRYVEVAYREGISTDMIHRQVQTAVENYHKDHNLTEEFGRKKPSVEALINEKLEASGLTVLGLSLSLEGSGKIAESLNIKVDMFKASVLGSIPRASVGLEALVVTRSGSEARSINKVLTATSCEEEMVRIARSYISKNITADTLYHNYHTEVKQGIEQLINEALLEYGKVLEEFSLSLHRNGSLDPIVVRQDKYLDGRIKNSYQLVQLKYRCELVADPRLHARVFLFPANTVEIEEIIRDQIRETLSSEINAEQFAMELNGSVSARLAEAINLRISSWGRRVGYLELETDPLKKVIINLEVKLNVTCQTKDGYDLLIKNTLLLQWDPGQKRAFEVTQVGDLEEWGKKQLERITKKFIINHTYNELLYTFSDKELRKEMQQEAIKLGYDVNQLIIIPEFQGQEKIEEFTLTYKDVNISSKVDDVPVAISVSVEGKIRDYSKIMLIPPKKSVTEKMNKDIDTRIRQFFHSVHPIRFYNRFHKKDEKSGDRYTLEEEIREVIANVLVEDYGAEIKKVSASPLTTKLMTRLKIVQEGIMECRFTDKTGAFDYKSKIIVHGVEEDGWAAFTLRGYHLRSGDQQEAERSDIVSHVKDYLENELNTRTVPRFKQGEIKQHDDFVSEMKESFPGVILQVKDIFGLTISIVDPIKIAPEAKLNQRFIESKIKMAEEKMAFEEAINTLTFEQRKERFIVLKNLLNDLDKEGYATSSLTREKILAEIKLLENSPFDGRTSIGLGDPFDALPPAKDENQ